MTNYNLITKRPFSDKIGACVWPYYDDIADQVRLCASVGMKYVSAGVLFDRPNNFAAPTTEFTTMMDLAKQYNLTLMVDWTATQTGSDSTTHSFWTTAELETIKTGVIDVINQLKGLGTVYVGWNEPNGLFWLNDTTAAMTDYDTVKSSTDMQIWLAKQERSLDSSCTIGGPAFLYCPDYMVNNRTYVNLINQMGLFKYVDAVSEHPYLAQSYDGGNPEQLIKYDNLGVTNLPKISNEFGYSRKVVDSNGWLGMWSQRDAAKLTIRQMLMMDYIGYSIITIYAGGLAKGNMDIFNSDGSLSYVAKSIKWLISELDGYTLDGKIEITEHVGYVDDLYLMKYTKNGAKDKLVYWTPSRMGELYGLVYEGNFYKLKFSDYPQILEVN